MQQFQIPQFIEVEDKIFGPLTTKQFFYLLGGGGLTFLIWFFLDNYFFTVLLAAPIIALSAALAFMKVNGRPFIELLSHSVTYILKPRIYLWKKSQAEKKEMRQNDNLMRTGLIVPKVTKSKLNDLAWSLDVMQNIRDKEDNHKT